MVLTAALLAVTGSSTNAYSQTAGLPLPPTLPATLSPNTEPSDIPSFAEPTIGTDATKSSRRAGRQLLNKSQVRSQVVGMLGLISVPPVDSTGQQDACAHAEQPDFTVIPAGATGVPGGPLATEAKSDDETASHCGENLPCPSEACEAGDQKADCTNGPEQNASIGSLIVDIPIGIPGDDTATPIEQSQLGSMPLAPIVAHASEVSGGIAPAFAAAAPVAKNQEEERPALQRMPEVVSRSNKMTLSVIDRDTDVEVARETAPADTLGSVKEVNSENLENEFHFSDGSDETTNSQSLAADRDISPAATQADGMQVRIEGEPVATAESQPALTSVVGAPAPTFEPDSGDDEAEHVAKRTKHDGVNVAQAKPATRTTSPQVVSRVSRKSISLREPTAESLNISDATEAAPESSFPVLTVATPTVLEEASRPVKLPTSSNRPTAILASQIKQVETQGTKTVSESENPSSTATQPQPAVMQAMTKGEAVVLNRQQASSLTMNTAIVQCSAEHPSICKLIRTSDKSVSLIGLSNGKTRIAIVTHDEHGEPTVEVREVQVGTSGQNQKSLSELANEISNTIASLYPTSRVEIVAEGQQLFVQGEVGSESEARKVLSLVRKTALTPVIDRLQSGTR